MSFGSRLKLSREKLGYTQQDIAVKLGISRTAYSGYESNSQREPDFETLSNISDLLDVSLDYLIKGKETETKDSNRFLNKQITQRLNELEKEFNQIQKKLDENFIEMRDMRKLLN